MSLFPPVASYVRRRSFRLLRAEMPFYEHRIDLYAFSRRDKATIAVELKLTKWRRALEQALLYQLCADFVFIAVPESTARRVDRSLVEDVGVGVIAVGDTGRCSTVIESQRSPVVRPHYRASYVAGLKELQ
jgi:hypothetical protein